MELKFTPDNFRSLATSDLSYSLRIRTSTYLTVILVKSNGYSTFGNDPHAKDSLKERWNHETDLLLLAWPGKYKTDIFALTPEDVTKHWI